MRFRTKEKPRGLLSRRDQRRLTLMMLAFGVVLVSMNSAGRPEFWRRLFPDPAANSSQSPLAPESIVDDSEDPTEHTVFRPDYSHGESTSWPAELVPADLLGTIRDNVIGVPADEARAYLVTLRLAGQLTPETAVQLPAAQYALFMDAPATCRGKAWQVTGTLRQLTTEPMSEERFGVDRVVEAWISLPDSGDRLVRVVALTKDSALRDGVAAKSNPPQVQLAGYFFKRQAYAATEGGLRIAPLLLANHIALRPVPTSAETRSDQLTPWLGWLTLLTCSGLGLVVVSFAVSDAAARRQRTHELTRLPPTASFDGIQSVSAAESLRALEQAAVDQTGPSVAAPSPGPPARPLPRLSPGER